MLVSEEGDKTKAILWKLGFFLATSSAIYVDATLYVTFVFIDDMKAVAEGAGAQVNTSPFLESLKKRIPATRKLRICVLIVFILFLTSFTAIFCWPFL